MTTKFVGAYVPLDLWIYKKQTGISTTKILIRSLADLRDKGYSKLKVGEVLTPAKEREIRKQKSSRKNK